MNVAVRARPGAGWRAISAEMRDFLTAKQPFMSHSAVLKICPRPMTQIRFFSAVLCPLRGALVRWLLAAFLFAPLLAVGQTLNISNDIQTVATLTNTTVTMTAKAELHVTGTGDPIPGCIVNLNSADAWFFMENLQPSVVASTFLSRMRVNGAVAVLDGNVRVVQYFLGAVVIPHAPGFAPMEVFDGKNFTGLLSRY